MRSKLEEIKKLIEKAEQVPVYHVAVKASCAQDASNLCYQILVELVGEVERLKAKVNEL